MKCIYLSLLLTMFSVAEDEFQMLQSNFMEKYYKEFEDTEENKFIYTDIHKEYVSRNVYFSALHMH